MLMLEPGKAPLVESPPKGVLKSTVGPPPQGDLLEENLQLLQEMRGAGAGEWSLHEGGRVGTQQLPAACCVGECVQGSLAFRASIEFAEE